MFKLRSTLACLLLLMTAPLAAQEPAPAELPEDAGPREFFDTFDVNLVNLEVFVTDKQGNPITGLTKDDFEILEDGRPVTITNFYTVEDGVPSAAAEPVEVAQAALELEDGLPGQLQKIEIPEDQRLYLIVYIDNFNIRPFNRNRVFRRLREFLTDKLGPDDRVMLVSYDRSLHYRHPFTSDPELIARATFELEEMSGHAVHADSDRRDILREIAEAESVGEVEWRVRTFAESQFNDLSFSVGAMEELIDSLAGLPGRKAMLYVSDGLPASAGEDMFYAMHRQFKDSISLTTAMEFNASKLFGALTNKANANRVTFYTIDAAGLRVSGGVTAEVATAGEAGLAGFIDSVYVGNLQAPLLRMAEETGGQAIINANDVGDGLSRFATDFRTYYSLGYVPAHSGDGRYYEVEVRLKEKQKGVKIRHRAGYRDKPMNTRMSDGAMATLVYDFQDNPLDVRIEIESMRPDDGDPGKYSLVDVLVAIPISQLELVEIGEVNVAQTKLFLAAMDSEGGTSDVSEVPINLRIPNGEVDTARDQLYPYRVTLRMRRGPHRLAVGFVDEIGSERSFVSRSFTVGS